MCAELHRQYGELHRRYHLLAVGVAYNIVRNHDAAQDAASEAFLKVYRYAAAGGTVADFPALLATTVRRCALDTVRAAHFHMPIDLAVDIASSGGDVADRVVQHDALRHALIRLSDRSREALVLSDAYGYTTAEVAAHIGCGVNAAAQVISRARRLVRSLLVSEHSAVRAINSAPGCRDRTTGSTSTSCGTGGRHLRVVS
ncbi:MAG: sigma-70 family RNA polymerase sigma factor [Nakamurella sp.]